MPRRKTIGSNPLDAVIPVAANPAQTSPQFAVETHASKERVTFHLSGELVNRARNAVFWTPGLTLAALAENALEIALERLETQRGAPFQARQTELKSGRPVKF